MPRDDRLYLEDILEAIERVRAFVSGMDQEAFFSDIKTQDAVIRNLGVVGEAAGKLSAKTRQSSPRIEWHKISALRNILVHEYFGVSLPILWDVVQSKLDPLHTPCTELLKTL